MTTGLVIFLKYFFVLFTSTNIIIIKMEIKEEKAFPLMPIIISENNMNIAIAVIILFLEKAIAMSDKMTENPLKNLIAKGTDDTRSSFDR
ncbi:TPA_asm: hypothetical protein G3430_000504 [Salmonella enterica subsp. houtenae serovar 18:z36,z38:-]|uniref:Uncharacterized protein n=1 Tax=Salmonella enterica subsp. houtenae serovar 18:z36,z38:- TaxID=2577510 RepID=A0A729K688_SALHO|nr:hypothetical protein [Salmonella enterica]HAE3258371.1 hypothetical protein [Salmonella enterica subsp. houtenae serovar 18:z36,z38:-]